MDLSLNLSGWRENLGRGWLSARVGAARPAGGSARARGGPGRRAGDELGRSGGPRQGDKSGLGQRRKRSVGPGSGSLDRRRRAATVLRRPAGPGDGDGGASTTTVWRSGWRGRSRAWVAGRGVSSGMVCVVTGGGQSSAMADSVEGEGLRRGPEMMGGSVEGLGEWGIAPW